MLSTFIIELEATSNGEICKFLEICKGFIIVSPESTNY
jgi:hypothetical protein